MRHSIGANWPPLSLAWRFVARGALVWLFLRTTTSFAGGARGGSATAFDVSLASTLLIASIAATVVWIDARRRHELHFLGNLGVPRWPVIVLAVLPAVAFELARMIAVR